MKAGVVTSTLAGLCCLVAFAAGSKPVATPAYAEAPPAEGTTSPLDNCPPDFVFQPWSGVVCVQDPDTLPAGGGLSYTGTAICVEGTPQYEQRPTSDGEPTAGTGGATSFPFLKSCDAGAPTDGGDAPPATVPDGGPTTATTSDGGGDDRTTRILIGLGGSGGAMFVTLGTARLLMRRWNMTPRDLLWSDLSAPPSTASGAAPAVPGGTFSDATTGEWVSYDYNERSEAIFTRDDGVDIGDDPGIEGHSEEHPAPEPDPEPEGEQFAEIGGEPGQAPDQPTEFGPSFYDLDLPDQRYQLVPDPEGGFTWVVSDGTVDDRFHATLRRDNRGLTGDVGFWPNRRLYVTYTYDPAGPRTQANWSANPSTDVTAIHQQGEDDRTFLWVTKRF